MMSASPRAFLDTEFEDNDSYSIGEEKEFFDQGSDEDTEDASETDMAKQEEFTEIKEQMYQQKLAQLKKQLNQLEEGVLPEYIKKMKKLEQQYKERLRINEIWYQYEIDAVDKEYIKEKKQAAKEFEDKKIDMKENIVLEFEDKKRSIELERQTMELTGDSMEVKTISTRKLRRRPNDPTPVPEKRRKASPAHLNFYLDEDEIMEDLRIINKVSGKPLNRKLHSGSAAIPSRANNPDIIYDARIDDGKLFYDKKWYHRGQSVIVESKEAGRVPATISCIGTQEVWMRRTSDNGKIRVYVTQLQKGKFVLKKKPS